MMGFMDMDASLELTQTARTSQAPDHVTAYGDVAISCYEQKVPAFIEAEIDWLYGHLLCSLSNFEVARNLQGVSTYIARRSGVAIAIFLFRHEQGKVTVANEFIELDQDAATLFTQYIFTRFPAVHLISFRKVHPAFLRLPYPHQAVTCTEDFVVNLPGSVEEYQSALGKNMRRNIKRYTATLQQDFPSYRYQVHVQQDIAEKDLRDIIQLNRVRMAGKNIVSRIDEEEADWIVALAKRCGIVGVATIDGRVCGGAIGFRIGDNYFMHVIAHDPAFNDYSLGILCYYQTICEGIARKGKRFHLLPGRYEYKYRLLGELREIASVDIYRSRLHALAFSGRIASTACQGYMLKTKLWLLDAERRNDRASRYAAKVVRTLRALKRSGSGSGSRSGAA